MDEWIGLQSKMDSNRINKIVNLIDLGKYGEISRRVTHSQFMDPKQGIEEIYVRADDQHL